MAADIMQKLEGDGLVFIYAGGYVVERKLSAGKTLQVDTGCVAAFVSNIHYEVQQAGGIKTALFGGEGLFFAELRGPGKVWPVPAVLTPGRTHAHRCPPTWWQSGGGLGAREPR